MDLSDTVQLRHGTNSALVKLYEDRNLKDNADVVITAGDLKFYAHKEVLCEASSMFRLMLKADRKSSAPRELHILHVKASTWDIIMKLIYTINIEQMSEDELLLAMHYSQVFNLNGIMKFLEARLLLSVNVTSCVRLFIEAKKNKMANVVQKCWTMMVNKFPIVASTPMFCSLHFTDLAKLLSSNDLIVKSEWTVAKAVFEWIEHREANRKWLSERLVKLISLSELTGHELKRFGRHPYILELPKVREDVFNRLVYFSEDLPLDSFLALDINVAPYRRSTGTFNISFSRWCVMNNYGYQDPYTVYSPWTLQKNVSIMWRIAIYPIGSVDGERQHMSVFLEAKSFKRAVGLDADVEFDIYIANFLGKPPIRLRYISHNFTDENNNRGSRKFALLSDVLDPQIGFFDEYHNLMIVGANIFSVSHRVE